MRFKEKAVDVPGYMQLMGQFFRPLRRHNAGRQDNHIYWEPNRLTEVSIFSKNDQLIILR